MLYKLGLDRGRTEKAQELDVIETLYILWDEKWTWK